MAAKTPKKMPKKMAKPKPMGDGKAEAALTMPPWMKKTKKKK